MVLVMFLMFLLATLQMISKVFSVALLSLTNSTWLIIWLGSEIGMFLLFKVASGDFVHCTPGLHGWVKYTFSFLARLQVKVIVDFTGIMFLANPYGKFEPS